MLKKKQTKKIQTKNLAVAMMTKIQSKRDYDCNRKKMKN